MMNGNGSNDLSRDLETDDTIKDPVEDRLTLAERNERLHDQLKVGILARTLGRAAAGGFSYANFRAAASFGGRRKFLPLHANGVSGFRKANVIDSEYRFASRSICVIRASDPSGGAAIKFKSARLVVRLCLNEHVLRDFLTFGNTYLEPPTININKIHHLPVQCFKYASN